MLLGDRIKKATTALGIKPCCSCEERAAMLNRRGFLGFLNIGAFALFSLKNSTLRMLWQAASQPLPIGLPEALAFVRQFNTAQAVFYQTNQRFGAVEEIIREILTHKSHFPKGSPGWLWINQLRIDAKNVLPGWESDHAAIKGPSALMQDHEHQPLKEGYRLVLHNERYIISTDESVGIFVSYNTGKVPKAADLNRAESVPSSVPAHQFKDDQVSWLPGAACFGL